jgi:hypothetical protein
MHTPEPLTTTQHHRDSPPPPPHTHPHRTAPARSPPLQAAPGLLAVAVRRCPAADGPGQLQHGHPQADQRAGHQAGPLRQPGTAGAVAADAGAARAHVQEAEARAGRHTAAGGGRLPRRPALPLGACCACLLAVQVAQGGVRGASSGASRRVLWAAECHRGNAEAGTGLGSHTAAACHRQPVVPGCQAAAAASLQHYRCQRPWCWRHCCTGGLLAAAGGAVQRGGVAGPGSLHIADGGGAAQVGERERARARAWARPAPPLPLMHGARAADAFAAAAFCRHPAQPSCQCRAA